ncbi:MAG TPA: ATP-binding protein [Noviherbaspirillum sp.]|uniref:ATP-binding protein n=1 Tax=Noviherbaspirillum sp. TaxID=1926288 RepID=UPI002DDD4924|nr:ATP-binding protein [Noviherbaspirillum sp.]HEV2609987.1 ATP-binding protein [Noviherbaspirillum sp.]
MDISQARSRAFIPANLLWHWAVGNKVHGALVAFALVALIAVLDYRTGYEIRLAILYMLPIALATWSGGMVSGLSVSAAAVACWGISFSPDHMYSQEMFYYWEGFLLAATFVIFVTLLHRLREALAQADARFLHVLNGLSAGIYVANRADGDVLYANQYCAEMVAPEVNAQTLAAFESRLTFIDAGQQRNVSTGTAAQFVYQEARDEQSGHWYLIQSTPIRWVGNEPVTLRIFMDITEQKQAQALKRQHQEMVHNTARSSVLTEIASMLGHEINQPLMAIAAYNNASIMLLSKSEPEIDEVITALEKCRVQAIRASHIVDRTRSFLSRRAPSPESCNINDIIVQAVQSLEIELQNSMIAFEMDLADYAQEMMFDRTLIEQVVVNLLRNAIDAVQQAGPTARKVSVGTTIEPGRSITVCVKDNGPGIAEEDEARLYTPFFSTKSQGLGLGLCICRSIIEAHAGQLSYCRTSANETVFQFTLPHMAVSRHAQA